jgi:hypothetical protein
VSKKLDALAPELHSIAERLGAKITTQFNIAEVTHLVHQSSRPTESFREFRLARSANIPIVHPQWLFECRSHGKRCHEESWNWKWDVDKNLSVVRPNESNTAPPLEAPRREKRHRHDENTPPEHDYPVENIKMDQITKLLGNVSSPQKKAKRKLAGRARNAQVSTASSTHSPEELFKGGGRDDDDDAPKPTQEKVQYKDPVAEREMAKIIANLQGVSEEENVIPPQEHEMTPAEDLGRRSARRKSNRK